MKTREVEMTENGSKYEDYIEELTEQAGDKSTGTLEALEAGADALAFVQTLWEAMGEDPTETPDLERMESLWDAFSGELSAAALFLSAAGSMEESLFSQLPEMLRTQADRIEEVDTDDLVPGHIVRGYRRFAARLDHAYRTAKYYTDEPRLKHHLDE